MSTLMLLYTRSRSLLDIVQHFIARIVHRVVRQS
ncbi:MAG: hypothetical protein ACJAYH_002760 [Celeribacter sp.]|jgi:hypothetical protein